MNTQLVVDLGKVQYVSFYYKTRLFGHVRRTEPRFPTVHGKRFNPMARVWGGTKTMLELATERRIIDEWIPTLQLQFASNHSLKFTGKKAISLKKEFSRRQFKPTTQKKG